MRKTYKPTELGRKAERALRSAVAEVVEEHRMRGLPLAIMENGKAVFVPADRFAKTTRRKNS